MYSPINTSPDEIIRNYCAEYCLIIISNNYNSKTATISGHKSNF